MICYREGFFSFGSAINITGSFFDVAYDYISWGTGIGGNCQYTSEIVESLQDKLPFHIQCQDIAIESIINAAASWEFKLRSGKAEPLVMAFTGPTGCGKSESAFRFAEAVLTKRTRLGSTRRYTPNGLLTIRGEDFSLSAALETSTHFSTNSANQSSNYDNNIAEVCIHIHD